MYWSFLTDTRRTPERVKEGG